MKDHRMLLPIGACLLVLGLLGAMAQITRNYGRPDPAEHNYNLLVRGFQTGQLYLNKAVPAGFARLADPQDPDANEPYRHPPYWLHDLSYYRGRLYLYFGISPALLLFWPFAALTGHYLPQESAVGIFCGLAFLAEAGLLLGLWRRYFPEVGPAVAAAGMLVVGLTTGMPILLQRAEFYEVAVSCGIALSVLALVAVWLAVEQPARRGRWLAAASLAYGLAVGARPSLLFGGAILFVPIAAAWRERSGAGSWAQRWRLLAAAVLPLGLCGAGLMLYNHLRFGSPFEFGQRYQLAAEREGAVRFFHPSYLWFNVRVYFLDPARWTRFFPFVAGGAHAHPPPGHATVEGGAGILINSPVLCLALVAPLAWRARSAPARHALRALVASAALLFGTCALVLCLFFGNTWRYEAEFLPSLALLATLGIFGLDRALAHRRYWRITARAGGALLLGFSIAFNLLESVRQHAATVDVFAARLITSGKIREGIAQLDRVFRLDPRYAPAYYNQGGAFVKRGEYDRAITDFDEAIRLNPVYAEAYSNRAAAYLKKGEFDRAIADANEAIRLRPKDARAWANRADAHGGKGEYAQAVDDYAVAIRLNPNDAEAYNNVAWLWAVCPEEGIRNGAKAVAYARKACELTGGKEPADLDTLAAASAEAGDFAAAVSWETRYLESGLPKATADSARERLGLYAAKKAYHEVK